MSQPASSRLAAATRLGPYEIVAPVGAGGMGEVYEARDTRLDRRVALKLLPAHLSADEQLRARLEREAKSISALNHPNICTLYDVGCGSVDGRDTDYLVMELVEGESLADRLAKGPLPLAEVLRCGVEIASALDAAHRRGIVHRDLKPGNVMLAKAGAKLLDFGLAKSAEEGAGVLAGVSTLRTLDKPLTEQGTIVGTFQYMSPEQLEGQPADARTDIFALGAVLYEMATGRKAFEGATRTSLIAAIVSSQPPPVTSVAEMTPPALDHVIRKCLEKDPDDRWQSARDVMAELRWIAEGGSRVGLPAIVTARRRVREGLAWTAFAAAALAALGFAVAWARRAPQPQPIVRFSIPTPEKLSDIGPPVVSPDGRFVAFDAAQGAGQRQVWLRPLDALEARPLPGTEGALRPFWSPDSRFLAFVAGGKLRKVDVTGGAAQTICDAPRGADGSWSTDGVILFDGRANDPIWRCPAAGGVAKAEVAPTTGSGTGWPDFLPDGKHFLYVAYGGREDDRRLMVAALDSGQGREVLKTSSRVRYAEPGYLLYVREHTLVAQPFDARKLAVTGEPVSLGEGLGVGDLGLASFSISRTGVLALRAGATEGRRLVFVDRGGRETPAFEQAAGYRDTSFAPDGRRLAFDSSDKGGDIWIRDFTRGVTSRFTFDASGARVPLWSPDGSRLVFSAPGKAAMDLMVRDASGTGEPALLLASADDKFPADFTRDGRYLLYAASAKDTSWDQWALPLEGERKPIPVAHTRFAELFGSFSPDGKLVAYSSNESGQFEVYAQEFPEPRHKWQVSTRGGTEPLWNANGRELFYRSPDGHVMAVPVQAGPEASTGTPQPLFETRFSPVIARAHYRPAPDGQRFLVLAPMGQETIAPATVVLNWPAALR